MLLMGMLFLSFGLNVSYPTLSSAGTGDSKARPFWVRVEQTAKGSANVPDCYKTFNGVVGKRITDGIKNEATADECLCDCRTSELN